jgi:hypothetical protein
MSITPSDELPPELLPILERLWHNKRPIAFHMLPRDAWTVLGIVQFASRNPQLSPKQSELVEHFGRSLQEAISAIEPGAAPYLEMGWDPQYDTPRNNPDDDPGQRVAPL